jgi:Tfp pilus assembly protein PilF
LPRTTATLRGAARQQRRRIRDIERALALNPELKPALLDLGILYFDSGQYAAAQQWFERADQQPDSRCAAALYLGVTRLRLGDPSGALPYLREAGKDPVLRQTAQYYEGVAQLRTGNTSDGKALLQQVQSDRRTRRPRRSPSSS